MGESQEKDPGNSRENRFTFCLRRKGMAIGRICEVVLDALDP
jgi:hypothetical protein